MTRKDCGSNTSGIHMMVDYWTELVGNWPNIKMRWHYSMFIKEDYWQNSLQWNGAVFMFHTNKHTFNINLSGATQTGVLAAGVLDLPFGNGPSVYHTPGCSTSFGNFSASGVIGESQSVGGPSVYECGNPRNINPFDAAIDYKLSNVRNYWRVYLWCAITGKTWNVSPDNGNGSIKVTGLNPESSYKITTKVVDRNGTVQYTGGVYASFTTPADQLKIAFNQGGRVKVARVYYNHNGTIKKVKKVYRNINGSVKKGVNYG